MRYIPAIKVSLTDIQIMLRILDKRIRASVTFMVEGFVYFINFFAKMGTSRKHAYIILTPLNPTFI